MGDPNQNPRLSAKAALAIAGYLLLLTPALCYVSLLISGQIFFGIAAAVTFLWSVVEHARKRYPES